MRDPRIGLVDAYQRSSHALKLNSPFARFSWYHVNCFWRDNHTVYTSYPGNILLWQALNYFMTVSQHLPPPYHPHPDSWTLPLYHFPLILPFGYILKSSLFWTVIIYASTHHTPGKHLCAASCSIPHFIFRCLGCHKFRQQQLCYCLGGSSGR